MSTDPPRAAAQRWVQRWDVQQERYVPDREERFRVVIDVVSWALARRDVEGGRPRVVDLGCGPGSLTGQMALALPEADAVGVDAGTDRGVTFQPRLNASWMPRLSPCPPSGGWTCAASPASSDSAARPKAVEALRRCMSSPGAGDTVRVADLSRLTRSPMQAAIMLRALHERGIAVEELPAEG
jgi:hypothetical protein